MTLIYSRGNFSNRVGETTYIELKQKEWSRLKLEAIRLIFWASIQYELSEEVFIEIQKTSNAGLDIRKGWKIVLAEPPDLFLGDILEHLTAISYS